MSEELLLSREIEIFVRDDGVLKGQSDESEVSIGGEDGGAKKSLGRTQIVPMYCEIPSAGIRL